jgi:Arc/MetJ family transcription regulator
MTGLKRTNIVIDEGLVERVKSLYQLRTTREAVDFALRRVVDDDADPYAIALGLEGSMILPELDVLRGHAAPDEG